MKASVLNRLRRGYQSLTLSQRFMLGSLVIIILGALGLAYWVGLQIRDGVINRSGATTALYVDSFIAPRLQELGYARALSPENIDSIRQLLSDTSLGRQIVAFKIWDLNGRVIYSSDSRIIDQTFPMHSALIEASRGNVSTRISVEDVENAAQIQTNLEILEIYSPVRLTGTNQVIAIAEYYQNATALHSEIDSAQQRSWLVVGLVMTLIYLLLAGFVRGASDTIDAQQRELSLQIVQLRDLLAQNRTLSERVRRAAARVSTRHENLLRRLGADLHDGPAQDLGLALLQIDTVLGYFEQQPGAEKQQQTLERLQGLLQHTLQEMRSIASELSLPLLNTLSLPETFERVVRAHERRADSLVTLDVDKIPEEASLPVKIAVYRIIQEALYNAERYGGGANLMVEASASEDRLCFSISDSGPGFDPQTEKSKDGHMGLVGMNERAESLGGQFELKTAPGEGTRIEVELPLQPEGESRD